MRKTLTALALIVVAVACGTSIDSADKDAADRFFDGKSASSQDVLCEALETPDGRAASVEAVQGELGGVSAQDMMDIAYGTPEEQQASAEKVSEGIANGGGSSERAEAIVAYIADERC